MPSVGEIMQLAVSVVLDDTKATAGLSSLETQSAAAGEQVAANLARGEEGATEMGLAAEESGGLMQGFLGDVLKIGGGIGGVMLLTQGFDFLKEKLGDMVSAGEQANQTQAQTEAALKSTHDASGMTAQGVDALADKYMHLTGITSDTIQQTENMLLTFTGISGKAFPDATQAALDMATALHIGPTQAALQLGKALNDPATGLTMLRREGVTFTAQQQEQIKAMVKAGDTAGAQSVMLKELNKEFGGSAAAAGQANGGLQIFQAEMENTKEKIGQALLPAITGITQACAPLLQAVGDFIPAALKFLSDHADDAKIVFGVFAGVIATAVVPALLALMAPLAAVVGSIIVAAAPFVAVGLAIAGVALLFKHLYETSQPFHQAVDGLVGALKGLANIFLGNLKQGFDLVAPIIKKIGEEILPHLQEAAKSLEPQIINAVNAVHQFADELAVRLGPAIKNIATFIATYIEITQQVWNAVWPAMSVVLQGVWNMIQGIIKIAWSIVSGIIKVGLDVLGGNWSQAWKDIKDMFAGVWDGIKTLLSGAWKAIEGEILGGVSNVLEVLSHVPGPIGDMAKGALGQVQAMANGINGHTAKAKTDMLKNMAEMDVQSIAHLSNMRAGILKELQNTTDPAKKKALEMQLAVVDHEREMKEQSLAHVKELAEKHNASTTLLRDQSKQHAKEMQEGVLGHIGDMIGGVLGAIGGFVGNLLGRLGEMRDAAVKRFDMLKMAAIVKAQELVHDFLANLQALPGKMLSLGGDIITGLVNGLTNAAGKLGDTVKSIGGNILGGMKAVLGIASPSRFTAEMGGYLMQGLAQGISATQSQAHSAAAGAAGGTLAAMSGALGGGGSGLYGVQVRPLSAGGAQGGGANGTQQTIIFQLDARTLARATVQHMPDVVRIGAGIRS